MPTYYIRPGTTLADGKLFVRGAIPQITQRPRIEYDDVLTPGVEVTITRAQWEDGYAPIETLTMEGVDVTGDITDNGDGTWDYTVPASGRLRYAAYPTNGAAYAGRVVVIEEAEAAVPVNTALPEIAVTGNAWTVTVGTWVGATMGVTTAVTLDGVAVGMSGAFTSADDGLALEVTETAENENGTETATVSHVVDYVPSPPVNTALPTITWDGNDWTVTPGTWTGADTVNTVVKLGGITVGLTGTLTAADDGKTLLVTETATNGEGATGPVTVSDVAEYITPPGPLAPYYASGTVGIHYATDAVTTDGGGLVTGLHNKGALGSMFDATVTGNPIAISGNALTMTSTSGVITSATAADLAGVRLMFVVGVEDLVNAMRFFGHVDGATSWKILANLSASGLAIQSRYTSGTVTAMTASPRVMLPASGFVLIEVEFSTTRWQTWINGSAASAANTAVPSYMVSNVGTGTGVTNRFLGGMGDVLGVLTGRADTAAAIAAVKATLAAKFGTPT